MADLFRFTLYHYIFLMNGTVEGRVRGWRTEKSATAKRKPKKENCENREKKQKW